MVIRAKIKHDRSVVFNWTNGLHKILGIRSSPDLQLSKNWSEVLKKVAAVVNLWLWRNLSLKGKAKVCITYIYLLVLYRFSVLSFPSTSIVYLVRALSRETKLLWCIASSATSIHPRQNSPVWWFRMHCGSAKSHLQWDWLFCQNPSSVVKCENLLSMLSFTAWSYVYCANLTKVTWSICCKDNSLALRPVLFVVTWTRW